MVIAKSLTLLVILHIVVFAAFIIASPDGALQVQYVPDDGYYYLTLARNYIHYGMWTFDAGISLTNGFHPMFAYLLSMLYRFAPDSNAFLRLGIGTTVFLTVMIALLVWREAVRRRNSSWLLALLLLTSSRNVVLNAVSVMEWPLVVIFASLYCLHFYRAQGRETRLSCHTGLIQFALGVAGSLARSDFGLLPLAIFVAVALLGRRRPDTRSVWQLAFVGFAGACAGALLGLFHNYILTGSALQSSMLMKAHWSEVSGNSVASMAQVVKLGIALLGLQFLGPAAALILTFTIGIQLLVFACGTYHKRTAMLQETSAVSVALVLGSVGALAGYTAVYSRNSDILPWYSSNLIVPLFILLVAAGSTVQRAVRMRPQVAWAFVASAGLLAGLNLVGLYPIEVQAPWPHQKLMREAGIWLGEHSPGERVGAWNAGSIGYYEGGHIVNLDGLVNNDVYAYATAGTLPAYLAQQDIRYVVDFDLMLTYELAHKRGGYDSAFVERLHPVKFFCCSAPPWERIGLYEVDP